MTGRRRLHPSVPYLAFGAFGIFWGTWAAALPLVRSNAGLTDAELGVALLFIGAGALPAMAVTGRLLDKVGSRLGAVLLAGLAVTGIATAALATDLGLLIAALALVGATSGAADVCINAITAEVENSTDRPILSRSHGVFSAAVVVSTLETGALLEAAATTDATTAFLVNGVVIFIFAVLIWWGTSFSGRPQRSAQKSAVRPRQPSRVTLALVSVGIVGALAYAIENGYQSWGALFVLDFHAAGPAVAAYAPAAFAAITAVARLTLAPLSRSHPRALLAAGGLTAAAGSVILASSGSAASAFVGIALAALGTATLFPTLLSQATKHVSSDRRSAVTSLVATIAYFGFLLGPAGMGLVAGMTDLRGAFLGIAVAAACFALLAALVTGRAARILAVDQDTLSPRGA